MLAYAYLYVVVDNYTIFNKVARENIQVLSTRY
jgi:hypothetical protein